MCVCVCVTVCTGRQTDTVEILAKRSRSSYTHTYTGTQVTSVRVCLFAFLSIPDSWLPNSHSLSLLIQSHIPTCIPVCLCVYIFVLFLFVCFSESTLQLDQLLSWLRNSLFLLDTGGFICPATSCRPCQRTFLPGFHRFSECVCLS